jgi:hypothetical protein
MRANNSHHLAAAARERAERTRAKALRALQDLEDAGHPVTYEAVASKAGAEGRCASAEALRSAWTCSMIAWPRWVLSAATVSSCRGVVVKNAWKRHRSNRVPCPAAFFLDRVHVGDPAHDEPARDLVGLLLGGERGVGHLGDLRPDTQVPVASSKIAFGYSIGSTRRR